MITPSLLAQVATYVKNILTSKKTDKLYFHDLEHTLSVVNAVKQIGIHCGISEQESKILEIAAWFHDTGYIMAYREHEDHSITICFDFLVDKGLDESTIIKIIACIASTRYPQKPQDLLQEIICDADMYHLSGNDYQLFSAKLKQEWEVHLDFYMTDDEWNEKNKNFFLDHQYFTAYGRSFLEPGKQENLFGILSRCPA